MTTADSVAREAREYTLPDDNATLTFVGVLLASATSRAPGKKRWAEISIYRTDAGKYVVHGVGRTLVDGEVDRPWCAVSTSAEGVVQRLTRRDGDVEFIPKLPNRAVAAAAALLDSDLHEAYYNHRVA